MFAKMAGLATIASQFPRTILPLSLSSGIISLMCSSSEVSNSFSNLISNAGLSSIFLSFYGGQSGVAMGFAASWGGNVLGRMCGEIYNTLRSQSLSRSEEYMRAHNFNYEKIMVRQSMEECLTKIKSRINSAAPESFHKVVGAIIQADKSLGEAINEYPTFNFIYKKILNEHQGPGTLSRQNSTSSDDDSFYSADDLNFMDAEQYPYDLSQASEIEMTGVTERDQLRAAEEGLASFRYRGPR